MASSSSAAVFVPDVDVWLAVAGASVRIPPPNSAVYYFPQGHLEQHGLAAATAQNPVVSPCRPFIPCRVLSFGLLHHPLTEQPLARILLQPASEGAAWRPQSSGDSFAAVGGNSIASYAKVLSPSDANNGGGFSIPRSCAERVFPRLDFGGDRPAQNLRMRDAAGIAWEFRHIYRGTPRRHLLTTGWSKFVNAKRLVAGDSVVFVRRTAAGGRTELFVGIRRAAAGSWESEENPVSSALAEMGKAARGLEFEVVYSPKIGLPDFVVEARRVEAAWWVGWRPGIRVRMDVETVDSTQMASSVGTVITAVVPENGPWRGSPWRMLQVAWDEQEKAAQTEKVSPWEVKNITPPNPHFFPPEFPSAKKLKALPDANSIEPCDHYYPNRTFTKHLIDCTEPPRDEIDPKLLNRHSGSSSSTARGSSFRLFGKTIQTAEPDEGGSESNVCKEALGIWDLPEEHGCGEKIEQ
ncbi:Auxin response factor 17 [Striga hermonthica]|uniref:Auxin response factor n=1 Tax=Striga hermonthica TaxID=68872 RepID=A0A9N7RF56_STRHE|nr:Auxin response factor 17 [Striga hermonthica]